MALTVSGAAFGLGLGELRSTTALGSGFSGEVEVLIAAKEKLESGCFRLRKPIGDESLPWLRQARLTFRPGEPAVLQIRSDLPQYDPVLQVSVIVGCGYEVARDFTVLLNPAREGAPGQPPVAIVTELPQENPEVADRPKPHRARVEPSLPRASAKAPRERPKPRPRPLADRLVLSGGGGESDSGGGGETGLRMAPELSTWRGEGDAAVEAKRDLLRMEFRTLLALNARTDESLSAAEKVRQLEAALAELKAHTDQVAQQIERAAQAEKPPQAAETSSAQPSPPIAPAPEPKSVVKAPAKKAVENPPEDSTWMQYGILTLVLLGLGAFLGWREVQKRRQLADEYYFSPEAVPDPQRETEFEEPGGVDLNVEPTAMGKAVTVDLNLGDDEPPAEAPAVAAPKSVSLDSQFSVSQATVDEHFEANPVMELAEIMLSFGRVKGAAQALQDFIDNNPEEALQPWIRLLDVYRLAGMQDEFERVAADLNKHFNVEVQRWDLDAPEIAPPTEGLSLEPRETESAVKAKSIEELPHVCEKLHELWRSEEVLEYLHRLLRDNRGGKRSGFTLEAVHEILFLVELKETLLAMEKEA